MANKTRGDSIPRRFNLKKNASKGFYTAINYFAIFATFVKNYLTINLLYNLNQGEKASRAEGCCLDIGEILLCADPVTALGLRSVERPV